MKRFFIAVSIVVFATGVTHPVHAQTATPKPTVAGTKAVDAGTLNQLIDTSQQYSIGATETATTVTIPDVNLTAGKDFKVPKLDAIANFFATGVQYLTPYTVKQKTINQDQNLFISGKATYCKISEDNQLVKKPSNSAYTTEVIPELSTLDQASRFAAAITTQYSLSKTDGEYNYNANREPLVMDVTNALGCDDTGNGTVQDPKNVKITSDFFNRGGLLTLLKTIFGTRGVIKTTLSSKQLTPYAESMDCLITGCGSGGDLSYLSPEEQKKVQGSGGVVQTYAPPTHDITSGESTGSEQNTFESQKGNITINTNSAGTKAIENATNYMKCSILPKSLRDKFGLAGKCQQAATATDCSSGSIPEVAVKSACALKNNTFGLSEKLIKTIEQAASTYEVPASLMLGVIYGEGSLNPNSLFTTKAVDTYLDGCTPLPDCSENASIINNIVPYYKSNWIDVADAVKKVAPDRTPNVCNLTDGIYALAETLHRFQYAPAFAGKTCFGIALASSLGETAQTCAAWKDTNVESAIRFWEFGNGWDNTTKSCATKMGSCVTGGGLAAQCPTGGDTCDTVSSPYAQASHNACVWNVYKNN